jgi:uncharacterized membrane protein
MDGDERTDRPVRGTEGPRTGSDTPIWSFRGVRLGPGEFTTSMVHMFRAEIARANVWRQRLDTTTNWAVVITVAVITVSFSESGTHHGAIALSTVLMTLFLYIEARRYRYYELWSYRVRLMETDFFAPMLVPPFHPDPDWAESLAENLLQPTFSISIWEAIGRRLRRNYLWIFLILALAWVARIWLQPVPAGSWSEFVDRAAVGQIPGGVVVAVGAAYSAMLLAVGLLTLRMQKATGEVLPRFGHHEGVSVAAAGEAGGGARGPAWFRPHRRRSQLIALVVTTRAEQVSDAILAEMNRGVTALHGRGMYTRDERCVLLCAITVTEVSQVKSLVVREDPAAFVIVAPAQEVLGEGFAPL